ncbi:peptidase [Streptomyces hygroscopicus]|uniref:DUF5047 domain-containing protein n=1 Tax=Streptomyces hygroscopicus TaxID=1912 RepID=UPI0022403BEF|nr:DUF5047 domain-containing protein [Streptomyces hygroscopicus]MCW7941699.1 peptidase [Streptomyces hygroscopicus]
MYTAPSSGFLPALLYSHTIATQVTLIRTDGSEETLQHTGGSVTADRGQATRRTCSVTLADTTLIPRTPADRLSVYGAQLRISRGLYISGSPQMVPIGMFRIDSVDGDPDVGPVTISGSGFEAFIQDDAFTAPRTVTSATSAVAGITALIRDTLPNATVVSRVTDTSIGTRTWDRQADRWAAIQEVAIALGAEVYADANGDFVISALATPSASNVVWEVAAKEGGAYVSASRGMSRSGVINSWTAYGENSTDNTPPVQATVEDTDSTSPTHVSGPFGRVRGFYSSPTLTTTGACTSAATAKLALSLKPNAKCDLTAIPNPLLEPGDVIRVVYPDGVRELHQIQSLTIQLDTAAMSITTISAQEAT